jgi:tetratricopeptide (TPR) repeat protein
LRDFQKTLIEWDVEINNIHLAWNWAVEQGRVQGLLKINTGLGELYETNGRYGEGVELFQQAAARLYPIYQERKAMSDAGYIEISQIYCHLLAWQSWFTLRSGLFEQAQALLGQVLALADQTTSTTQWHRAFPFYQLGLIDWYMGDYASARQYLGQALTISKQTNGAFVTFLTLNHLGLTEAHLGNYQAARHYHEECLTVCQGLGMETASGMQYICLARLAYFLEDYPQAEQLLEKGLDFGRMANQHLFGVAYGRTHLGLVKWQLGQPEQGRQLCLESLEMFNQIGERYGQALALDHLGQICWALADDQQSKHYFVTALKTALEIKAKPQILSALLGLARHLAQESQPDPAAQLLAYIMLHSSSEYHVKDHARRLLAEMQGQDEPSVAAAPDDRQVEKIVQEFIV